MTLLVFMAIGGPVFLFWRSFFLGWHMEDRALLETQRDMVLQTISQSYRPFVPVCRDADGVYKEVAGELEPGFRQALLAAGKLDDPAQSLQPGFDGVSVLIPYKLWHSKDTGAAVDAPDMGARYDLTMRAAGGEKDCDALAALVAPQKD